MFGLLITRASGEDVIKISTNKQKLLNLALEEITTYLVKNKNACLSPKSKMLMDIMGTNDTETAMDIFGDITQELGDPIFMAITKAEIIFDA